MRSHTYTDDLERQGDPQPGMSRHHREWNAENGVREPAAVLSRMAEDVRNRLIDRVGDIGPGDRVTARLMLEAVGVIREATLEIERLRAELARYKRMYCRMACRDLYASGVKWKTKPGKMRDDGVFIEEDCEPGKNRTWAAFPIQFAHDDAAQIVELLNRAADELAREAK